MAPSAIAVDPVSTIDEQCQQQQQLQKKSKPTVYMMDDFHPAAVTRAQELFNIIPLSDPEHRHWKQSQYLLLRSSRLSAKDIAECPNLLAVGKQGVGTDKIDSDACAERGIKICNTPGVNARAVAELVLAMTTAIAREIRPIAVRLAHGEVVPKETCSGLILHKSRIAILGMGNIGRTVAKIFQGAFESSIVAYDPFMPPHVWSDIPHVRAKTVDDVLRNADVVTVHVPLTDSTKGMISYPQFQLMKPNTIVINTARGGIVHEQDLCRALDERLIWGAGLDCHVQEPPTKERYELLWKHPNVLSLPHVGAATAQTQAETAVAAVEHLYEYSKLVALR
jgi:phosphoglycerate dehydrogenase-like enzyme